MNRTSAPTLEDRRAAQDARVETNIIRIATRDILNPFGRAPFVFHSALNVLAQETVHRMIDERWYGHGDLAGLKVRDRLSAAGFSVRWYQENVAWGNDTGAAVVAHWMTSRMHRSNIINPAYKHCGIGTARSLESATYRITNESRDAVLGPARFWCMVFWTPEDV